MSHGSDAIRYLDESKSGSVAELLDGARELLVQAWERGEDPDELVVDGTLYAVLCESKAPELALGRPLVLLGLYVSNESNEANPKEKGVEAA